MRVPSIAARKAAWGGLFVLLLLAVLFYTWLVLSVRSELQVMQKQAVLIKSSLVSGDATAASRALERFSVAAESARSHTGSFAWDVLDAVPWLGKNASAIATVSDVGASVAADAIAPVVDEAKANVTQKFAPHNGRIDLAAVTGLQPTLRKVDASLMQASQRVNNIDTGGLLGFVGRPLVKLRDELAGATSGANAAYRASRLLPSMLGPGTHRYLLMFDNNAEIRSTGGMPGAWAVITASNGKISMTTQGTAAQIGEFPQPVLPQTNAEQAIYYNQISTYAQDTNFTPEFPRTADLLREMWLQRFHTKLDGVMSLDVVSLGNFLKATGPVTVDGVTLTSANAADELLNGVYLRYPTSNTKQDAFFKTAAQEIFSKVMKSSSPTEFAKALSTSVDQGRVYLHSFNPVEQSILGNTAITGLIDFTPTASPQVGVYLNDATGSKMSYYLRTDVTATAKQCSGGKQTLSGSTVLSAITPPSPLNRYITGGGTSGTPVDDQTVLVRMYGPVGGSFSGWRFDGQAMDPTIVVDRGRAVATVAVQLGPGSGKTHRIEWTAVSGPNQTAAAEIQVTPGMVSRPATQHIASACG